MKANFSTTLNHVKVCYIKRIAFFDGIYGISFPIYGNLEKNYTIIDGGITLSHYRCYTGPFQLWKRVCMAD